MNNFDQFEVVTIDKKDYENLVKDSERMAQAITEAIIILKTNAAIHSPMKKYLFNKVAIIFISYAKGDVV